jgi:ribosomal-protein-alanine acetyltransferase
MIRPATIEDLPALLAIETRAFTKDRISRRAFHHLLTRANAVCLLDVSHGQLRGYAALLFRSGSQTARLYSIAADPRSRGQGIGRKLLTAAERECRRRGCTALRLEVRLRNARARRLYARRGYRVFGRYETYYEDGADALRMEKQLRPARARLSPPSPSTPSYARSV